MSPIVASSRWLRDLTVAALTLLVLCTAAWADPPGRVGRLAGLNGTVWIYDGEQGEWVLAQRNRPLTTGDRLATDADARAEMQVGSTTMRVDGSTELQVVQLDDRTCKSMWRRAAWPCACARATSPRDRSHHRRGQLRAIERRPLPRRPPRRLHPRHRLGRRPSVRVAGQRAGRDRGPACAVLERARRDPVHLVRHRARQLLPMGPGRGPPGRANANPYVSPEMTGAEDLDRHGTGKATPSTARSGTRTASSPGWAPYRMGHWTWVSPWGWTWVDDAPWGFAPFHYGRWVMWRGHWAWAPGRFVARPIYAPALVAWIGGSNVSVDRHRQPPAARRLGAARAV